MERLQECLKKIQLIRIVEKILGGKRSVNKRLKLYQLKGVSQQILEELALDYYRYRVKPNLIEATNKLISQLKGCGFQVLLVSGGYDVYLKYFVEEYHLDGMLSSSIEIKDGVCTGKMNGLDCMRENKISMIEMVFKDRPDYVVAYSDSLSDLPLLLWADKGVAVSRVKSQNWAKLYKFEEIIWEEGQN